MDVMFDQFLIAMPGMADETFAGTVVYLCEHNDKGALGLVINKPIDIKPVSYTHLYQMVMTAPRGGNLSQMLEESVSKLRLAEEAVADIEGTLGDASAGVIPIHSKASARDQRRTVGQRV